MHVGASHREPIFGELRVNLDRHVDEVARRDDAVAGKIVGPDSGDRVVARRASDPGIANERPAKISPASRECEARSVFHERNAARAFHVRA